MVGPALDCSGNVFWLGCDTDHMSTGDAEDPLYFTLSFALVSVLASCAGAALLLQTAQHVATTFGEDFFSSRCRFFCPAIALLR